MDNEALEILIKRNEAEIFRYLIYLGAEYVEAEDTAQETFIAAFESKTFPNDGNPKREAAWLRGTARNLLYMHFNRNEKQKAVVNHKALEKAEEVWLAEFQRGGDGFDYAEALRECLKRLPAKQAEALKMKYEKKQSRKSMARLLALSGDGVKSLLRRIRLALRKCIMKRLDLPEGDIQ